MPHLWFGIHLSQWNLRIRAANARCKQTTTKNLLDLLLSSSNISKFDRLQEGLSPVMALLLTFFLNKRYMPQFSNQTNQGCNNVLGFWISQSQISFLSLSVMVHNSKTYLTEKKKKNPSSHTEWVLVMLVIVGQTWNWITDWQLSPLTGIKLIRTKKLFGQLSWNLLLVTQSATTSPLPSHE